MNDIRTLTLSIDWTPTLTAELRARCEDSHAAERVVALLQDLSDVLGIQSLHMERDASHVLITANQEQLIPIIRNAIRQVKVTGSDMQQANNLKQIGLAILQFESKHRVFPPRMSVSPAGQPLLSWRVFILPYLGEQQLYDEFHLDEPWDSPHNRALIERMPPAFGDPLGELPLGMTRVQLPLFEGSAWSGIDNRLLSFRDLTDSTSNTISHLAAPRNSSVIWTQPEDFTLKAGSLVDGMFGDQPSATISMFDSSVHTVRRDLFSEASLKALLTHQGNEPIQRPF